MCVIYKTVWFHENIRDKFSPFERTPPLKYVLFFCLCPLKCLTSRTHAHRCPRVQCGMMLTEAVGYRTGCVCFTPQLCLNTCMQLQRQRNNGTQLARPLPPQSGNTLSTFLCKQAIISKSQSNTGLSGVRHSEHVTAACFHRSGLCHLKMSTHSYSKIVTTLLMSCIQ